MIHLGMGAGAVSPPHRPEEHGNTGEVTESPRQGVLPSFVHNSHLFWCLLINVLGVADGAAAMLPLQLSNPVVSCFPFPRQVRMGGDHTCDGVSHLCRCDSERGQAGERAGWKLREG